MIITNKKVWLVMSKCRKYVAKGTPRHRVLVEVDNPKDNNRFLTYTSKRMAEAAFASSGFSTYTIKDFPYDNSYNADRSAYLEAVECTITINTL